jgi:hypothetical protein
MFELKRLSPEAIDPALSKAERYRLLNEPWEAESICLDILDVEPRNQAAVVTLILARTDQFGSDVGARLDDARALVSQLDAEYERAYYAGIICERWGESLLERHHAGTGPIAYDWLRQAMTWYERAEAVRPAGNDDALLRWNTCARTIMRNNHLRPEAGEAVQPPLE